MQVIDLRGVNCPTNFVKVKLALQQVEEGHYILELEPFTV